jgi:hypothetical protein
VRLEIDGCIPLGSRALNVLAPGSPIDVLTLCIWDFPSPDALRDFIVTRAVTTLAIPRNSVHTARHVLSALHPGHVPPIVSLPHWNTESIIELLKNLGHVEFRELRINVSMGGVLSVVDMFVTALKWVTIRVEQLCLQFSEECGAFADYAVAALVERSFGFIPCLRVDSSGEFDWPAVRQACHSRRVRLKVCGDGSDRPCAKV